MKFMKNLKILKQKFYEERNIIRDQPSTSTPCLDTLSKFMIYYPHLENSTNFKTLVQYQCENVSWHLISLSSNISTMKFHI